MIKAFPIGLLLALFSVASVANPERLEIALADSSTIMTYLLFPQEPAAEALPLMILMPPGSGEAALAFDLQSWLGAEIADQGWAVAVPVSPDQKSFRGANSSLIPQLIDELQKDPRIINSKVVLAGVSNGGISALEIASLTPDRVAAVIGVPAVVSNLTQLDALTGMPVYLRIGDQDELMWMNRFEETKDTLLAAGTVLNADLLFMSPHMFPMDWENLEPWLDAIRQSILN